MPRSYHFTYIYLLPIRILWPLHLQGYLYFLTKAETRLFLLLSFVASNKMKEGES